MENTIGEKSYCFSVRIVRLYRFLNCEKNEPIIARQILKSGTSIGANVEEAMGGCSGKDFSNKLSIAYKECRETKYWLKLLKDTDYIKSNLFDSLYKDCDELAGILYSIIRTMKRKSEKCKIKNKRASFSQ